MKKTHALFVLAGLTLSLSACGGVIDSSWSSSYSSEGASSSNGASSSSGASSNASSSDSAVSSSPSSTSSPSSSEPSFSSSAPVPTGNVRFEGIQNVSWVRGHYFDPLKGVKAFSENQVDLTSSISVHGAVDYGRTGQYALRYDVAVGEAKGEIERNIAITEGTYSHPARNRADDPASTLSLGKGSYRTGNVPLPNESKEDGKSNYGNLFRRPSGADYLDNEVYNEGPIPTNTWWSGFEHANYGGSTLAALNPLNAGYFSGGLYLSYKGTGFTQYFQVADTFGKLQPTMSNFAPAFRDIVIKPGSLSSNSVTKVIGYGKNNVTIAMRNSMDGEDEMVNHLVQGSPYVVSEFKDPSAVQVNLRVEGVTKPYEFYDLSGSQISADSYQGSALVIKLPQAHCGYETTYPNVGVGAAVYKDLFYLLCAPEGTSFAFSQGTHANVAYKEQINLSLKNGNYVSFNAMTSVDEAAFYKKGAGALFLKTNASYAFDGQNNVITTLSNNVQYLDDEKATPRMILMPHQWKNGSPISSHEIKTVKGTNKVIEASSYSLKDVFHGILPGFVLPDDPSFSTADAKGALDALLKDTVPGTVSLFWGNGGKDFINSPGPYWCGKALYPLSQGLIAADQLGLSDVKATIRTRLHDLLADWYTYSGDGDARWLYYDKIYGSVIYSADNFSTNTRLSDHHFTSGYLIYASAVLSMYDASFLSDYGEMAKLLLKDYMNYDEDPRFPSFRGFDTYAGHSWADGFGDFGDGNDQESCGEALNSWAGAYLLGVSLNDSAISEAAAWGYTSEMEAVKQYWFNYDEDNWIASLASYTHAIGISWGCKNDYATWFGSNPEFIYGIHWLPTGEYLTSYAIGESERATLRKIYQEFLLKAGGSPRTWYSNMWAVQSLVDPSQALSAFSSNKILSDDYPDELLGSYWMVHAMQNLGWKDKASYGLLNPAIASSLYVSSSTKNLVLWNPSDQSQRADYLVDGVKGSKDVAPRSFVRVSLP